VRQSLYYKADLTLAIKENAHVITDMQGIIKTIIEEITQHMDIAVVGMSGGADSTLTAILCQQALGAERVHSLHMPANPHDEATFNYDSRRIATALGIHQYTLPVAPLAEALLKGCRQALGVELLSPVNEGNARARGRMCMLYTFSHHLGLTSGLRARVVGTGNLSEDFIGYDTKGGDSLADLFPIGDLFKSEVYQMLDYFVEKKHIADSMINRVPSAGLWPEQTDERELGYTYNEMETAIRACLGGKIAPHSAPDSLSPVEKFVLARHRHHGHKHQAPPVTAVRKYCD
jgi:NAD+ synthase